MLSIFFTSFGHLCVFFGEMSIHVLCPFFNQIFILFYFLLLSCMSSLYTLGTKALSDILFTNMFSHSVSCLFVVLSSCFAEKCSHVLVGYLYYKYLLSHRGLWYTVITLTVQLILSFVFIVKCFVYLVEEFYPCHSYENTLLCSFLKIDLLHLNS